MMGLAFMVLAAMAFAGWLLEGGELDAAWWLRWFRWPAMCLLALFFVDAAAQASSLFAAPRETYPSELVAVAIGLGIWSLVYRRFDAWLLGVMKGGQCA